MDLIARIRERISFPEKSLVLTIVFIVSTSLFAQAPTDSQPDVPVFRSVSRLVVVDVVVTDHNGKSVTDLTKDDFEVLEDRVPQRITQFESARTAAAIPGAISPLDRQDILTTPAPSLTVFVLDELNTTYEEANFSRRSLVKYLKGQPARLSAPAMVMALTNTEFPLLHDYTRNTKELVHAIEMHHPDIPWKLMKGWNKDRLATSLVALQQIAAANLGRPGRKNVVWIGRGFTPVVFSGEIDSAARTSIENAINRTVSRLLESRVTVYTIDPTFMTSASSSAFVQFSDEGDVVSSGEPSNPWSADINFADFGPATGGLSFRGRNDIETEISESVANGSTYYMLAYVPTNRSDDPKYRRIRVRVGRPGLTARTRDGYFGAEIKPTEGMVALDMSQAVENTFAYSGLQLKLSDAAISGSPAVARCLLAVDSRGLTWTLLPNGDSRAEVEVAVATFSAHNKLLAYEVRKFGSTSKPQQRENLFKVPSIFPISTTVSPEAVRLRFAVRDNATGRMGTLDLDRQQLR